MIPRKWISGEGFLINKTLTVYKSIMTTGEKMETYTMCHKVVIGQWLPQNPAWTNEYAINTIF